MEADNAPIHLDAGLEPLVAALGARHPRDAVGAREQFADGALTDHASGPGENDLVRGHGSVGVSGHFRLPLHRCAKARGRVAHGATNLAAVRHAQRPPLDSRVRLQALTLSQTSITTQHLPS